MLKACWFMVFVGCVIFANGALGAYLPHLGPSPLRFRTPPSKVSAAATLPPLPKDETVLSPTNAAAAPATNIPPIETLEPLGPPWPDPASVTAATPSTNPNTTEATPPLVAIEDPPIVTPQMVAEYLRQHPDGTNAAPQSPWSGSFIPPLAPPSSSATYKVK